MLSMQRTADAISSIAAVALFASVGIAQVTQIVSVATGGAQADGNLVFVYNRALSADGRYVAFSSNAANLVAGDVNGKFDAFVRDRLLGVTECVSVDPNGIPGNDDSDGPTISSDGRYVAFSSAATNLTSGATNPGGLFVRDRLLGITECVSVNSAGEQGGAPCSQGAISADGRHVTFVSAAANLVPGDTNDNLDVFVRDLDVGITERVSVSSSGVQGDSWSWFPSISADGRFIAFESTASNFGPHGFGRHIFVRDRQQRTTELVSVTTSGAPEDGISTNPAISGDGRYVAFLGESSNLVPGDTNQTQDIFVRDRMLNITELVSVDSSGVQANGESGPPAISADGRYVGFENMSTNLVPGDTNSAWDVFVRDRQRGLTERVSVSSHGIQGNSYSLSAIMSDDGRFAGFRSVATNLVPGDLNGKEDIFVRDRNATGFTSLCDPRVGTTVHCPCANPPTGPTRGCDNSASTGGAILSASGIAYVTMDSLVFTTSAEKPTATSIVMQGSSLLANGLVFGQGVRCVGGTLKRLYTKTASGGSITAPQGGDLSVSARSSALGDMISAGQSRWYLVYYRDPIVLGGCPSGSTFNATQTARIDWSL